MIERESDGTLVISDEGGEFARSTTIDGALHYAGDLLHSPHPSDGVGEHALRQLRIVREAARSNGLIDDLRDMGDDV